MELEKAMDIVMQLASDGIMDEREADQDPEILVPMRNEQCSAVNMVAEFFNAHLVKHA